uniref:Eukaryotic translation initiation factor 2A n=1 Tax=Ditylenchus dipsaci TaxID=166011 RepID=A0A915ENX9_9BILA
MNCQIGMKNITFIQFLSRNAASVLAYLTRPELLQLIVTSKPLERFIANQFRVYPLLIMDGLSWSDLLPINPKETEMSYSKFAYLCYCDSIRTVVIDSINGQEILSADLGSTADVMFSPHDTFMVTYEPCLAIQNEKGNSEPNVRLWSLPRGRLVGLVSSGNEVQWYPQFTNDECTILIVKDSEILFYRNGTLDTIIKNVPINDVQSFVVSPGTSSHLLCFIPFRGGRVAEFQLRKLDVGTDLPVISSIKTASCCESVMMWNSQGTVVLASAEVDYEETSKFWQSVTCLYIITIGGKSIQVVFDGSEYLYNFNWTPDGRRFAVSCGGATSQKWCALTFFVFVNDHRTLWEYETQRMHCAYFDPTGFILAICEKVGAVSGELTGKVHFWNIVKKELMSTRTYPLAEGFEWIPNGDSRLAYEKRAVLKYVRLQNNSLKLKSSRKKRPTAQCSSQDRENRLPVWKAL